MIDKSGKEMVTFMNLLLEFSEKAIDIIEKRFKNGNLQL